MPTRLEITAVQLGEIIAHVESCQPEEACGLVAGIGERVCQIMPVENCLHSSARFQMAPAAQWAAFEQIEASGQELLAIFHSHPCGPACPSPTDIAEFFYPGVLVLIVSPRGKPPESEMAAYQTYQIWQVGVFEIVQNDFLTVKLDWTA